MRGQRYHSNDSTTFQNRTLVPPDDVLVLLAVDDRVVIGSFALVWATSVRFTGCKMFPINLCYSSA